MDITYEQRERIRLRIGELTIKRNGYLSRLNELSNEHHLYSVITIKIRLLTGRINNLINWFNP